MTRPWQELTNFFMKSVYAKEKKSNMDQHSARQSSYAIEITSYFAHNLNRPQTRLIDYISEEI